MLRQFIGYCRYMIGTEKNYTCHLEQMRKITRPYLITIKETECPLIVIYHVV